jgi:hypothetical protein
MARRSLSRTGTFKARSAPGNLRLLQAFVNTRDVETGGEELWNPQRLAEWLERQKLVAAGTEIDTAAWDNALEIREALRRQFRVHNGAKVDGKPGPEPEGRQPVAGGFNPRLRSSLTARSRPGRR